jgi:paraquat-inducible protein B
MVDNIDVNALVKKLSADFDALIDERQELRVKSDKLKKRLDEIDRKLKGIQTTLQGLTLYTNAQDAPTELTKKTTQSLAEIASKMNVFERMQVAGPDVKKTLTECCRDILRAKKDWMSPVEIREALMAAGFDFSNYTSNPLSSIHTTLKRMVPEELATETRSDGQVYRWRDKTSEIVIED